MNPLETALEELSHDAPRPVPHPDLWDRGRRLRRRDRLVSSALVLVLVLLAGGLATLITGRPAVVAPAGDVVPDGAIPSRIVDVPPSVTGAGSPDLAVGRASVAFISSGAHTVLVSATDGSYHRVELPDRPWSRTMRLSPDGTHLAYVFAARPDERAGMVAGVAVVDLASGQVERTPAANGSGTTVDITSIGWSPDSRWVAWSGHDVVSWGDAGPVRDTTGTMGAIDTDTWAQFATPATPGAVGVSDDGRVVLVNRDEQVVLDAVTSETSARRLTGGGPAGHDDVFDGGAVSDRATTSADGSLTAVGQTVVDQATPFVTRTGEILRRRLDHDLYPQGGRVTPLGWAAPSLLMAMVEPGPGSGSGSGSGGYVGDAASLVLLTPPDRPEPGSTYRYVVRDLPDIAEVSVAVDLVPDLDGTSSQRLTREFPDPDWPMPPAVRALLVGGAALGLLLAAYLLRRRTRRLG